VSYRAPRGLEPHGVEITDLKGITYNPVEGDWRLSRDLAVNYLAFGVKKGR
jgi:2-polyprenyl-3-methyl-5-hydroxy-6-metoxy-1,4-benzoquinol methylase